MILARSTKHASSVRLCAHCSSIFLSISEHLGIAAFLGMAFSSLPSTIQYIVNENGECLLAEFRNGKGKGFHQDGSSAFEEKEPSNRSFLKYSVPGWEGMAAKQFISGWRYYRLIPFAMRQANTISEQLFLNEHGDNLSAWLLTLQTRYRDEYTRLEQAVKDILPDITSVLTPTQVGTTFVLLKEKFLKKPTIYGRCRWHITIIGFIVLIFAAESRRCPTDRCQ